MSVEFDPYNPARQVHPHPPYPEHEREWKAEGDVRTEEHQGDRTPLCEHRAQESRSRAEPEVGPLIARAGELTEDQVNKISDVIAKPLEHNIPLWFLNRQKDPRDGVNFQMTSNQVDTKLREDLERMRKMRLHRGLRHLLGLKVRGQKTNKTGRRGKTVGVSRKK